MKYQLIIAGIVVTFGIAAYALPSYTPQTVNREAKQDRETLNFAERWDAVKQLETKKYPALAAWMRDHGIIGEDTPVVAKEDK
jgi:hypothetical protein